MPSNASGRPRSDGLREGGGVTSLAWLATLWAALLFPLVFWIRQGEGWRVFVPETPLDETHRDIAQEWSFLWSAGQLVPPGATVTFTAGNAESESRLFFLSIGLLPGRRPLPTTYWNNPAADGAAAEYRLDFGCDSDEVPGFERLAEVPGGCVWKRRAGP